MPSTDTTTTSAASAAAPPSASRPAATPPTRRSKGGLRAMLPRRSAKLTVGIIFVTVIIAFGVLAPFFTQDPRDSDNAALAAPSGEHLLGTTKLGFDVLAQLAQGTRGSLMVGLISGVIALSLSVVFGILAGYMGGWADDGLSLVTNIMLVIPGLPLVMVIATYFPARSWLLVAFVLGITSWAGSAVVLRAQARSLRRRDYVSAARVAGEKAP